MIFHFISSLKRGGRERQLAVIVKHSDIEKFSSKIIYLNDKDDDYLEEYGITDKKIKISSQKFIQRLIELHKLIKETNPDIIFTWGNLESILVLFLKPFHKFIFINGSIRHGIRSNKFWHYVRTLILHLGGIVVANSKAGLKAEKLKKGYVLYNGIDHKKFNKLDKNEKLAKRNKLFNTSDDTVFFISIANLVPYKDYFTVLKALKVLKEEGYDFYYMILGDGPLRTQVQKIINKFRISSNIKIIGHVQNVNDYLEISDYLIHSSKGEGCSNAILEAMFSGLPVIATNVGGTSELVYKKSFRLFEFGDSEKLTEILLNLKNEFTTFDSEAEEYKNHLSKFTVDTMISNYQIIIEEVTALEKFQKRPPI